MPTTIAAADGNRPVPEKTPPALTRIRRERLRDPDVLRAIGLTKVRTGRRRGGHRIILFCPKGIRRRGACVPQAILHLHR